VDTVSTCAGRDLPQPYYPIRLVSRPSLPRRPVYIFGLVIPLNSARVDILHLAAMYDEVRKDVGLKTGRGWWGRPIDGSQTLALESNELLRGQADHSPIHYRLAIPSEADSRASQLAPRFPTHSESMVVRNGLR
jgi:hypothetical protein